MVEGGPRGSDTCRGRPDSGAAHQAADCQWPETDLAVSIELHSTAQLAVALFIAPDQGEEGARLLCRDLCAKIVRTLLGLAAHWQLFPCVS